MILKKLCLEQYRNIRLASFEPARNLTILFGFNGQGKTNILESIYLLSNARPFRSAKLPDLIHHKSTTAVVRGLVHSSGIKSEVVIKLESSNRRVTIDGKAIHRSNDLHGKLSVVLFSPDDTAMIKLGPETRRRFLDRSLYASDAGFLDNYHSYYRTLKQRNALLKKNQIDGLDIWTEQMAISGSKLMAQRQRYTAQLNPLLQMNYQQIAGKHEKVEICYRPDVSITHEYDIESLLNLLNIQKNNDVKNKTTGRGPHRDDLIFLIEGRPLKIFGSQGQQRSFILALKMAELEYLHKIYGEMPVLLLDDIASELDQERIANLLTYVRQKEIQVFITTTDVTPFHPMLEENSKIILITDGTLTYEGNGLP